MDSKYSSSKFPLRDSCKVLEKKENFNIWQRKSSWKCGCLVEFIKILRYYNRKKKEFMAF
jgi:hypothetical protein